LTDHQKRLFNSYKFRVELQTGVTESFVRSEFLSIQNATVLSSAEKSGAYDGNLNRIVDSLESTPFCQKLGMSDRMRNRKAMRDVINGSLRNLMSWRETSEHQEITGVGKKMIENLFKERVSVHGNSEMIQNTKALFHELDRTFGDHAQKITLKGDMRLIIMAMDALYSQDLLKGNHTKLRDWFLQFIVDSKDEDNSSYSKFRDASMQGTSSTGSVKYKVGFVVKKVIKDLGLN